MPHPLLELARTFTVDWLDRADPSVPPQIMTPDYLVHIGDVELVGLPAYTAGTLNQLQLFPGLLLTIHRIVCDGDRLAMVFTEHGGSARHDLWPAAWRGVALFRWDGTRLTENWTQEDYYARRRQIADRTVDVIAAPAPAPWTTPVRQGDPGALAAATDWLRAPDLGSVIVDDARHGPCVSVEQMTVEEIFAAGSDVAFAATWTGTYQGGLDSFPDVDTEPVTLGVAGVLQLDGTNVAGGQLVTDRLGLRRQLALRERARR